jgi:hypothetical protein
MAPGVAGNGLTVMVFVPVAVPHVPPDEVRVSVAVPEKATGAVQVAFKLVAIGENVPPADEVHVPPMAGDVTLPPSAAEVPPAQIAARAGPAFTVGLGVTVTARVLSTPVPHEFCAVTPMLPFCPEVPVVTVIEFAPAPAVMVHPVGTVQLYEVAFVTRAMLYT